MTPTNSELWGTHTNDVLQNCANNEAKSHHHQSNGHLLEWSVHNLHFVTERVNYPGKKWHQGENHDGIDPHQMVSRKNK